MKFSQLSKSLAGRTALLLFIGFTIIQTLGLAIHTFNQINLGKIEEEREIATRDIIIYRHIAYAPPAQRAAMVAAEPLSHGATISLGASPPSAGATHALALPDRQMMHASFVAFGIPPEIRPLGVVLREIRQPLQYIVSFALPDPSLAPPPPPPPPDTPGVMLLPPPDRSYFRTLPPGIEWLTITTPFEPPRPWRSPGFASAFIFMAALGAAMIIWAVRQLTVPVRTLADAAERLGRDVINAPNLPESGPTELVTAALAFNTMASRIRRFVQDRTFLLTAIGHDLRTPITRLKLRAEYMEDEEQRLKMLADLDEMESMVAATLAFGRDIATSEAVTRIDLAVLLQTILDEAADGDPDHADALSYSGPEHLAISARPLSLKRALTNLIGNALKYGDAARVSLAVSQPRLAQVNIDDNGPGVVPEQAELIFEPFRRLETSRNRETGGSGLGLSIARNIVRAHGGDIALQNLPGKGLRATVTLPI